MVSTPAEVLLQLKNKYHKDGKTIEDLRNWVTSVVTRRNLEGCHAVDFWYHNAHLKFLKETRTFSIVSSDVNRTMYFEICLPLRNYLEHYFGIGDFDQLLRFTNLGDPDWDQITSKISEHIHLCVSLKPEEHDSKIIPGFDTEILRKS
jgi:hypothetical protein